MGRNKAQIIIVRTDAIAYFAYWPSPEVALHLIDVWNWGKNGGQRPMSDFLRFTSGSGVRSDVGMSPPDVRK